MSLLQLPRDAHTHTPTPTPHHTASASTACKAARFQPSTPRHQDVSFQLPSPHAPRSPCCHSSSPLVLFSPPGHSLPNALGPGSSCWLMTTRYLVAMLPASSQSLGFASQLSREPQVLAQRCCMGLTAPEIPIQRLSFMKDKAADQAQDSAPQGTPDCQLSLAGCGSSARWKAL